MAHPREKIALGVVRPVGFFFRFAQRFLNAGAIGHVMRDAEDDLVLRRPGRGPKHVHDAAVLADVTIDEVGDLAGLAQTFAGLFASEPVIGMNQLDVRTPD